MNIETSFVDMTDPEKVDFLLILLIKYALD